MKISYNLLKNYIKNLPTPDKLSELLTNCGLEVESIQEYNSIKGGLKGFVIGEVLSKEKHPDADKLSICKVNIGDNMEYNVVCGASNVEKNQKILFATIGTNIYEGDEVFTIKKSKIRGVVSEGMICAEDEVGLGSSHDGIMVLPNDAIVGTPASEYFNIYNDFVFEIGLTPNRNDAVSHIGVARDIAAVLSLNNFIEKPNNFQYSKVIMPDISNFKINNKNLNIEIEIQNQNCIRYSGLSISEIKIGVSPKWLQNVLKAIGIRPINNIVDITNFVLFETGQPLHAFDAAKIIGNKVIIKTLDNKTKFTTLDEIERELSTDDLMICNTKEPMCIAGVFGGLSSGINEYTTSVFLESACFSPSSIRKTSKRHNLKTDASFRYERGSDPEITIYTLKRAAMLICEIAGGNVSSEIKDLYPTPIKPAEVFLNYNTLNQLAGYEFDINIVKVILESLNINILKDNSEGLLLSIPQYKNDVNREVDLIEEIMRVYGYNNIPLSGRINASLSHNIESDSEKRKKIVSSFLCANGFNEIMCNSLSSHSYYENNNVFKLENCVKILNPLSKDLDVMRQSLLYGGLDTINYNRNRKINDIKLFEFGNTYKISNNYNKNNSVCDNYIEEEFLSIFISGKKSQESWYQSDDKVDFYYLKAFVNNIFKRFGINQKQLDIAYSVSELFAEGLEIKFKNILIAEFGEINSKILKSFDIKEKVFFANLAWNEILKLSHLNKNTIKEVSKFPEVRRDLALIIDKNINYSQIEEIAYKSAKNLLKNISLFDVYEGDNIEKGKKSYAVRFILEDKEKTLTDEIIDGVMNKLIADFKEKLNAKLR